MSKPLVLDATNHALAQANLPDPLSNEAFERIVHYFARRKEWAVSHNLAGPKSLQDPMIDLMDACALRDVLTPNPLFDVGSGSGTPGLLLACIQPERTIILVEPLAKRTAFLKSVSYELNLRNVSVYEPSGHALKTIMRFR